MGFVNAVKWNPGHVGGELDPDDHTVAVIRLPDLERVPRHRHRGLRCRGTIILPPILSTCYNHFIPIVGVGKRGAYWLVHGDLPRQHPFVTTLRFIGPVPADSPQ